MGLAGLKLHIKELHTSSHLRILIQIPKSTKDVADTKTRALAGPHSDRKRCLSTASRLPRLRPRTNKLCEASQTAGNHRAA